MSTAGSYSTADPFAQNCGESISFSVHRKSALLTQQANIDMEELELGVWIWLCKKTQKTFESMDYLGDFGAPYGEFLLHARNDDLALWNTAGDSTFDKCFHLIDNLFPADVSETKKIGAYHAILGTFCDPAPDGSIFQIRPYCPYCDDNDVYPVNYISTKRVSIPEVTHHQWDSLTDEEKKNLVLSELRRKNLI